MLYGLRPWTRRARGSSALGRQVEHAAVAVVDRDLGRAAGKRALDRGVGLAVHQLDCLRVEIVPARGRLAVADAGDALHVDRDVDLHHWLNPPPAAPAPREPEPRSRPIHRHSARPSRSVPAP